MVKILLSVIWIFILFTGFGQKFFYVNYTLITSENKNKCWHIIPADNNYDSYTQIGLNIKSVEIIDNCLKIYAFYGGGCGEVYMTLFSKWETVDEKKVLKLIPDFLELDFCRALWAIKISFDISPYTEKYPKPFKLSIMNYEFLIE